jgi:hypothetical protein
VRSSCGHNGLSRIVVAGMAALLPLSVAACDEDTAGPETGADVEDITEDDYFGDDEFLGESVTVSAEVTDIVSGKAFEIGGAEFGDESLLVVHDTAVPNLEVGTAVQASGTVRQFRYDEFVGSYDLGDPLLYEPYGEEEFLLASIVDTDVPPDEE